MQRTVLRTLSTLQRKIRMCSNQRASTIGDWVLHTVIHDIP
ncbi:hypothetical protein CAEBREN_04947 [Caenorhabditis brenneri]|uniref:Uncharacterized protein n=1 Tax=Caenorhabditis brenneri TaxID=135651 RepID=G0NRH8_CAEBE|nr:hypothetical protein CAEBREN_04947 [Caenorhabditis brenneri]